MSAAREETIGALYAAAVEPDALERMAGALRSYLDTDSAGFWLLDRGQISHLSLTADIAASNKPYLEYYRTLDPWMAAQKEIGQVYLSTDTVDERELVRTEFYQDFARHYGMLRPMGLVMALEPGVLGTVSVNRTDSRRLLGEADRALFQDLAVHLRGALALWGRIARDRGAAASTAQGDLLASLRFPAALCDANARANSMNDAFAALFADGTLYRNGGGAISAATAAETGRLRTLIHAAATRGEPGAMRLTGSEPHALSALLTPLGKGRQRAVLISMQPDHGTEAAAATATRLRRLFDLSPAQAELCVLLLGGHTFEEVAAMRGIAVSTARSHFLTILQRTGATNLRDLLRLLGSLPQTR